ncbi:ImmA/IrrE family metallo-endopeptidase [Microbacterium sp. NPDC078428]|uniref:ImmA/IrrE family metallo-endopeptidase n=1 Tax=Microbacterium sp. NPDC078428 TaxID=3364190 RepID=UPI0037C74E69
MSIDHHLEQMAATLGVRIEYALLPPDRDGEYRHRHNVIRLRRGMPARLHRSVLAHELAHAVFGDTPSRFGPINAKQERRADEWAALRLIHTHDYRRAETIHDGHPGAIAVELGVVRSIVEAYQRVLTRLDDTVYVQPKMGAGQWAHREHVA